MNNDAINEIIKNSMNNFAVIVITLIIIGLICGIVLNKLLPKNKRYNQEKFAISKGKEGEKAVNKVLSSLGGKYTLMKNILLKTKTGSTELDHIVVSVYGIFVIETKNYSGRVYGDEKYKDWKHFDMAGKEHKFYSPIKQNAGHLGTLRRAIKLDESVFIPIVVFSGSAEIKVTAQTPVVQLFELKRTIKSYKKKVFTKEEVKNIIKDIKCHNIDSVMARKQHVKYVKSIQKD